MENTGLTDEEVKEKERLLKEGFPYWDAWNYRDFLAATNKYGREDIHNIAFVVNKPIEEVKEYHSAFWSRGEKLIGNFSLI